MAGAFHAASDMNRLYAKRSEGGRALRSIEDLYQIKTVEIGEHFENAAAKHRLLQLVKEHEKERVCRLESNF